MNRIIKVTVYLVLFFALLLSGCQIAGTDNTTDSNIEALEGVFAKTHLSEVESEEAAKAAPKAAVPYYGGDGYAGIEDVTIAIPTASPVTVANYPEYGQTSVYSIAATATADVYKVSVTTSYSSWSVRETQEELYYIYSADSIYDTADTIRQYDNFAQEDSRSREKMQTVFRSSFGGSESTRYETIEDDTNHALGKLAALDSGSMNYDSALKSMESPATDAAAAWSSEVSYTEAQAGSDSVVSALLGFS
ncbi:MAG TPA: hypothetical protein PLB91_16430, partial [Spirochaetales bacterium]|nr:hypothetical protein [Spirochaetales bacterium]